MLQGKTINGFTLQRRLGVGGMAEVWYAENEIGMKTAVKIMSDELLRNAQMRDRFLNEAKVMVKLDHPNIRKVYGYGDIDGRPAIIMEYLEGMDLKAMLKGGRRFTDEELRKWWDELVSALNYTHAQNIVHRDIKPSNIFLDNKGDVRLLDFGIAKVADTSSGTQTGSTLGTRIYMSPEQVKDPKRVGPKSDVYSLAVSFVHLLTGKAPYDSTTTSDYEIQVSIVTKPVDLSPLPESWRNFLAPYLEKDPANRPELKPFETISSTPTPPRFDEDEGTIVGGISTPQANGRKQTESKKQKGKKKWLLMLVAVVAVVLSLMLKGSKNYARPFSEGLAFVQLNGKVGYINKSGKMVFSLPQCDLGFDFHDGLAAVRDKKSNKWGYIDKTGRQIVSFQYSNVDDFSEGLAHVVTKAGEHYFIDKTGKRIISIPYDAYDIGAFHNGMACVRGSSYSFFIDKKGEVVLEFPQYDCYDQGFKDGLAAVYNHGVKGFINLSGQLVMSLPQYDQVNGFSENMACVGVAADKDDKGSYKVDNIKWGYINKSGAQVIRPQYNYAWDFSEGLAAVGINGKFGYIDKTGRVVIPLQYDWVTDFSEGLACVRKNNKCYFIDKSGKKSITVG